MSNAVVKILDWGQIYQESLATEILRSERRRVTIFAALFAFAACFYTLFAFVPALLTPEFRVRFQTQWPRFISLYGAVAAYEWTLRAGIGWLIEHRRRPNLALRFVNAFVETSIPRRAWLPRLPALFLFYSALDTSIGRWIVPLYRLGCGRGAFYFFTSYNRYDTNRRAGFILANARFQHQPIPYPVRGGPRRRPGH